jgi:hypothetical protein
MSPFFSGETTQTLLGEIRLLDSTVKAARPIIDLSDRPLRQLVSFARLRDAELE